MIARHAILGGTAALLLIGGCGRAGDSVAPAPLLTLEQEVRIGSMEGETDAFGRIDAVEAEATGRVFVADGLAREIRVFSPAGSHERTIGRRGSGPGEFRMIAGLALDDGGRLWVMDPAAARFTVFDADGALKATYPRPLSRVVTIPWLGGVLRDGGVYDVTQAPPRAGGEQEPGSAIVRYDAGADRLHPTHTFVLPDPPRETFEARTSTGIVMTGNVPLTSEQQWRVAPDGSLWIGRTGEYSLLRVSLRGDSLSTIHHHRARVALSRAERDSIAAAAHVDASRIPSQRPAFTSFFVDDAGRVWVEPPATSTGTEWDVFSPQGALLATVRTPLRLDSSMAPLVRGPFLFAVVRDEMDVPGVIRFRIPDLPQADRN